MKQFLVSCGKFHGIDIRISGGDLQFTRDFEGKAWNCCADHSDIKKNVFLGKNCMKCKHLIAESI